MVVVDTGLNSANPSIADTVGTLKTVLVGKVSVLGLTEADVTVFNFNSAVTFEFENATVEIKVLISVVEVDLIGVNVFVVGNKVGIAEDVFAITIELGITVVVKKNVFVTVLNLLELLAVRSDIAIVDIFVVTVLPFENVTNVVVFVVGNIRDNVVLFADVIMVVVVKINDDSLVVVDTIVVVSVNEAVVTINISVPLPPVDIKIIEVVVVDTNAFASVLSKSANNEFVADVKNAVVNENFRYFALLESGAIVIYVKILAVLALDVAATVVIEDVTVVVNRVFKVEIVVEGTIV